jgi:hypothetical protein
MATEYEALQSNKTWHLVPPWSGVNIIDYRWVYMVKIRDDVTIDRYKA